MDRSTQIRHRMLKAKFDKHREHLDKHKERGPAFKEAVERLERIFNVETPRDSETTT